MSKGKPKLYIATPDEIRKGLTADIYFHRTVEVLRYKGLCDVVVRAELHVYSLPKGYKWAVFAGLEEALWLLKDLNITVYSIPEGTVFFPREPLMVIEGPYCEFAILETALLGILRHASSIATKAARIRIAAGDKKVLFFGLRALHPAIAPMADRAAYIGGVDGVAGYASKKHLGLTPVGTMPHALIVIIGDPVEAWKAFDEALSSDVPRIALVDTFFDERYEAVLAYRTLKDKLAGIRLDTPSSRRGNMRSIIEEVRWALKLEGAKKVRIIVSGGLDEKQICELRDIVDAFGVGTSIAFPPSIDISMDIVEVFKDGKWIKIAKRGKLPGARKLYYCSRPTKHKVFLWDEEPMCEDGSKPKPLMIQYIDKGKVVAKLPTLNEIRNYVLEQLSLLENHLKDICSDNSTCK